jgi:hypothetical protein|tara:strand:- start:248 stop:397 length:150 start_codon:yes stop_codon:yes gene_type:complete
LPVLFELTVGDMVAYQAAYAGEAPTAKNNPIAITKTPITCILIGMSLCG